MPAPAKNFTTIADSSVDGSSPLDTTLVTALRDNDQHLEEWLGKDYTAAQNHEHSGVDSAKVKEANLDRSGGPRVFDDFLGFIISTFWKGPATNPPAIPAPGVENGVIRFPAPYTTYISTIDGVTDNRTWKLSASPANTITFETRLRMLTAGGYAADYSIGLVDALGAAVNNGVFFYKAGTAANWWCRTQSGGTATDTDSGVAQSTTYQKLKIVASGTSVSFYIDDVLKATHTTNIPTVKLGLSVYFITLSTYEYDVDYVDCASSVRV